MENEDSNFEVQVTLEKDYLLIVANGSYSLIKANNLFKLAIDSAVSQNKNRLLIHVTDITGDIPFFDRFHYSEFLANYKAKHGGGKISRIAVVGQEPIVHKEKFGETVAVNRGVNVRVFTDMSLALTWLNKA